MLKRRDSAYVPGRPKGQWWKWKRDPHIIDAVLSRYSITVEKKLQGTYAVREYCVQYDESSLDFVSRLMEEEGIFYFFTFTASSHTLVLADSASAHVDCPQASACCG